MISNKIQELIGHALKAKDEIRLSTLRLLSSSLNYEKIAKQHELSEEEELAVVRKEAKKRQDAIDSLGEALNKSTSASPETLQKRLDSEKKELEILKEYLPEEMSDEELTLLVDDAISQTGASEMKDMGKVIGVVMQKASGRAEGRRISELVKSKLS